MERGGADGSRAFGPLPPTAHDYGVFDSVLVNHESVVTIATNRYSVPAHLVGQALTARLHPARVDLYAGAALVATHPRHFGRHARLVVPEHYEAVFVLKPRARAMVYRDWLVGLSTAVAEYVALLCRRRYGELEPQLCALYVRPDMTSDTPVGHIVGRRSRLHASRSARNGACYHHS